jgi:hypothetical protein
VTVIDQDSLFARLRETPGGELPAAATDELQRAARESEGRSELLALVNRHGLTNVARLGIISALGENLEAVEAHALARAVVRQHPSVVLAAVPALEASHAAAALFAVRKPLRRGEKEVDEACDHAASRLGMTVAADRFVRREGVPPANYSGRELAYVAAAAAPETLAAIREGGADKQLSAPLGRGIESLLTELTVQARNGSLNPFDARLRDELHEAVILTGLPAEATQQERSLDNLFRRRDLSDVRELAAHLPDHALSRYAARALNRSNRRSERADRAVLALEMLETAGEEPRAELHHLLLDCLDEPDPALAAGAVAVLAGRADDLAAPERQRVIQRFGTLPPQLQQALAPRLKGLAASAEEGLDVPSFLRWVDGAGDGERSARLRALKTRWDTTVVSSEQATAFLDTLARGVSRLADDDQLAWRRDLIEGALSWMHRQGTQIVEPSRALLAGSGFAQLVLEDLDLSLSLLRADQARGLLTEMLRHADDLVEVVESIACSEVEDDGLRRVVLPVLGEAVRTDLRGVSAAFQRVGPPAQRRLLQTALLVAGQTKRHIDALGQTTQDAADAATAQHGAAVLAALRDAEQASEGNESIQSHFGAVRRGVESVVASQEVASVPEGVVAWRREAEERFSDAVEPAGHGCSPLVLREGAPAASVLRIVSELDQRVHSARVVSAEERAYLRHDLLRCIDYIVDAQLVEAPEGLALSGRPALGQLLWSRWAERRADAGGDLVEALSASVEAAGRQRALLKVDALAGHASDEVVGEVVDALKPDALGGAWSFVTAGLANRLRQAESLEQDAKTRGVEVMERVAERIDPPLRAIEGLLVGYFRLRKHLTAAGWGSIEAQLGKELRPDQLDASLHEVDGGADAERFVVRSSGVRVRGRPIRRAVVEGLEPEDEP